LAEPAPEPAAFVDFVVFDVVFVVFEAEPASAEPMDAPEPALSAVFGASANETTAVEPMSEPTMRAVLMSLFIVTDH
jgi:hypothetical protein